MLNSDSPMELVFSFYKIRHNLNYPGDWLVGNLVQ